MQYVLALLEYGPDLDAGPRLVGRLADEDLAEAVRARLMELRQPLAAHGVPAPGLAVVRADPDEPGS